MALPIIQDREGKNLYFVDGDTLSDDPKARGKSYRIKGFDAFEKDSVYVDDNGEYVYKRGESLGNVDTKTIAEIIKKGNFKPNYTAEKDVYNRELVDFTNDRGQDLVKELYRHGIARVDKFTSDANIKIKNEAELINAAMGNLPDTPYSEIARKYQAVIDNPSTPLVFKGTALNETEFDPAIHSGVQFRDHDKTIDNKPTGFFDSTGDAFFVGWQGVKEGFYGYLDAIGEITENEMIKGLGVEGVQNARNLIARENDLILEYDDVDSVLDGFVYVANNAAMSAPYLIGGFASLAAAVPIAAFTGPVAAGAIAGIPLSVVFAGHTWNEMEGPKGVEQFVVSNVSGVIQTVLERFGARGLIQPVELFTEAGKRKALQAVVKFYNKQGITITAKEAEKRLAKSLKGEMAKFSRFMADDFAKFSFGNFGKAVAKGMTREGLTEVLQESTQMTAVALGSDKVYSDEDVRRRLINAGLAGATLGGTFSGAANAYTQGKNQVAQAMYKRYQTKRQSAFQRARAKDIADKKEHIVKPNGEVKTTTDILNEQEQKFSDSKTYYDTQGNPVEVFFDKVKNSWVNAANPNITLELGTDIFEVSPQINSKNLLLKTEFNIKEKTQTYQDPDGKTKKMKIKEQDPINLRSMSLKEIQKTIKKISDNIRKTSDKKKLAELNYDLTALKAEEARKQGTKVNTKPSTAFNKDDDKLKKKADEYENTKLGIGNWLKDIRGLKDFVGKSFTGFYEKFLGAAGETDLKPERAVQSVAALKGRALRGSIDTGYYTGKNFKEYLTSLIARYKSFADFKDIISELTGKLTFLSSYYNKSIQASEKLIKFGELPKIKDSKGKLVPDYTKYSKFELARAAFFSAVTGGKGLALLNAINRITKGIAEDRSRLANDPNLTVADVQELENNIIKAQVNRKKLLLNILKYSGLDFTKIDPKDPNSKPLHEYEIIRTLKILNDPKYTRVEGDLVYIKDEFVGAPDTKERLENFRLFKAATALKQSYDSVFRDFYKAYVKATGERLEYKPDFWYQNQGFDYRKVKNDPDGFKAWAEKELKYSREDAENLYDSIVRQGDTTSLGRSNSLLEVGEKKRNIPLAFKKFTVSEVEGFNKWSSNNLFEGLNKTQLEVARWLTAERYFGQGGWKLSQLIDEMEKEGVLTEDEIGKFAYQTKSIVDSAFGAFNRIEKAKWAATNAYLSSWAIFAGLPLAAISSFPETLMIYFNLKDDADFKNANKQIVNELAGIFNNALEGEVKKNEKLLRLVGLDATQSNVVDRFATGDRDIAFLRAHETFFAAFGIQGITQFQRRMAGGLALDFIKSNLNIINYAPKNLTTGELFLDKFNEIERLAYQQLVELGINVEQIDRMLRDLDEVSMDKLFDITDNNPIQPEEADGTLRMSSEREQVMRKIAKGFFKDSFRERQRIAEASGEDNRLVPTPEPTELDVIKYVEYAQEIIDSQVETAIYRFINERVQLPQSYNRPLFFQDPHYQLLTQFNGFMSTFTANIVPKLWKRNLINGNTKIKYDTFALIILMMGMGAASQYLKDLIKYGETSPYLDELGYLQRALYASGVMGQYERIFDLVVPLYPSRDSGIDYWATAFLGEAGPTARILGNVATGLGQMTTGDTERGVNNLAKSLPVTGPINQFRAGLVDAAHLRNPFKEEPPKFELNEDLLKYMSAN